MRIFVHDNPGHAFAVQLSRWLAAEGHEVLHCYSRAMTAPRGELELKEGDPAGFQVEAIGIARPVPKYALLRRNLQESSYARALGRRMRAFAPDIVISGNGSPVIQGILRRASAADGARIVYWLLDIYCEALRRALEPRLPALAKPASGVLARYDIEPPVIGDEYGAGTPLEIAWPERKVGVTTSELEARERSALEQDGWEIVGPDPETVLAALELTDGGDS